ncbi:Lsr2 family DNA-binding protein [Streptomyces niveiscabiei]|uniref:Lsr2 family DNA-binding protein n=1 Tax=Streptomyces niveiscabiei TaxID=164115 RepID=UPI0006EBD19D|nr:histone-like nucleoid-structuring protein Lsr2 [Streptomyces niveiscabiei]
MFTDMKEALELTEPGSAQQAAASLAVAHNARDKSDLVGLLGALGLPCGAADLVRLLPHLPTSNPLTTGDPMTIDAFTATAASMLKNGDSLDHVREVLGLSASELASALQHTEDAETVQPAGDTDTAQTEALLTWAENHQAAAIRNRAARVRSDLAELAARRSTDSAQRAAEERVARAKAELEAAQAQLRVVKAGGHAATADQDAPPLAPAPAVPAGKLSKEELARIRTWARANGYQVADRGNPAKAVMDAYNAAHRTTNLAEAS